LEVLWGGDWVASIGAMTEEKAWKYAYSDETGDRSLDGKQGVV
jgi:hypothetical protein